MTDHEAHLTNMAEYSVSQLANAIKRTLEGEFGHVRVKGELGRVTFHANGHVYLDLKDDKAVIASVIWKPAKTRLKIKPEEGLEVIATGRISTFGPQSKYQLIIEDLELAGLGALMAMLERRKKALEAEGLFAPERKRPLPYLPNVIGVVTSPTGAVIRDILHRLKARFPRHVLLWPVLVQGERAAAEVAAAIAGFNRLPTDGPVPRPDLLIVARGGGSFEDLMPFNEEIVVRAAAASRIPLISAIGHETDTTLIDYAADARAPTPTAAAEMAVPVRAELIAEVLDLERRQVQSVRRLTEDLRRRVESAARALPKPDSLLSQVRQRLDNAAFRLGSALRARAGAAATRLAGTGARLQPSVLTRGIKRHEREVRDFGARLSRALERRQREARQAILRDRGRLEGIAVRLAPGFRAGFDLRRQRLEGPARLLKSLSFEATLERGYALVTAQDGHVLRNSAAARKAETVDLRFAGDDHVEARITGARRKEEAAAPPTERQGRLL